MTGLNILVLGAAYGLLPAVRMLLAGHRVTVVCRETEQTEIAAGGAIVTYQRRDGRLGRRLEAQAVRGPSIEGILGLAGTDVDLSETDLVFLVMGEPQYAAPEVSALIRRIAAARLPVVSLMNASPPPFLRRLETFDVDRLAPAYSSWNVWQDLDPQLVTAASPDAQAVRTDPLRPNELTVTLGSNFKVAPFAKAEHQSIIQQIARDVSAYRPDGVPLTVRILAHRSLYVPLAKWPMLLAGNCRCLTPDGTIVSIAEAVHSDLESSRRIYEWTLALVRAAGASDDDLVPFAPYANAARALTKPSSFARAIASGAKAIERVDKMVQLASHSLGMSLTEVEDIVDRVDQTMATPHGHHGPAIQ